MSIEIVKTQLNHFLQTDTPEVLAIRGAWGVGKTFAWNKYLNEAKHNNKIAMDSYSYVSLFGINSLDALKLSIFMEVIHKRHIGTKQDLDAVKSADKILSSLSRKAIGLFRALPYSKNVWTTIEALSFYSLRKTIVCIDDFERKGKDLDAQDVMGLVTLLKEQKNCKVVLILNDELLENEALIDYKKYREKVIDVELAFSPSAKECADIALSDDQLSLKLKSFVEKLGINNIRIIKKIERLSIIINTLLTSFEEAVVHQALQSLALFMWCFYSRSKSVPGYDFVKNFGYGFFGPDKEEEKEEEKQWKTILRRYNYSNTDSFDLQVAQTVENGYVDEGPFLDEARKLNLQVVAIKSEKSITEAWNIYHDSFDNNEKEVVSVLYDSFKRNVKYISPLSLDGTVRLFRELGKDELADEMTDLYITERKNEEEIFDSSDHHFSSHIKDKKIIEKFAVMHDSLKKKVTKTIKDVLSKIAGKDSWGQDDEDILSSASPEDYYALFKSEKGSHLSLYIDTCLNFGRFTNASEKQKKIAENATIALRKIGKESVLNAMRVKKYGIKLETKKDLA